MTTWRSAGDILRWWRTSVLGWTQRQTAERLSIKHTTLSNWERGDRVITMDGAEIDGLLKSDGVLRDLLWSFTTPEGLEPGRLWTKVFPGQSHPVWVWIRSPADQLVVEAEWGVTRMASEFELPPNGLFVTVAASVPDSPVVMQFSEPAWADFGSGELPPDLPDATVMSAVTLMERSSASGPLMDMFSSSLEAGVASGSREAVDLDRSVPGAVDSYTGRAAAGRRSDDGLRSWPAIAEGVDDVDRRRFARLRDARGVSRASLADRLGERAGVTVSRDTLRRFETGVGKPHSTLLPAALDHVLGAEGRLAVLEVRAGRGERAVRFPNFWRGPIWLELEDETGGEQTIVLRRGRWHRELTFETATLVSAHWFDPAEPLRIAAPPTTRWTVGIGRRAGATAIDQNWVPRTVDVAQQAVKDVETAIFTALDHHNDG